MPDVGPKNTNHTENSGNAIEFAKNFETDEITGEKSLTENDQKQRNIEYATKMAIVFDELHEALKLKDAPTPKVLLPNEGTESSEALFKLAKDRHDLFEITSRQLEELEQQISEADKQIRQEDFNSMEESEKVVGHLKNIVGLVKSFTQNCVTLKKLPGEISAAKSAGELALMQEENAVSIDEINEKMHIKSTLAATLSRKMFGLGQLWHKKEITNLNNERLALRKKLDSRPIYYPPRFDPYILQKLERKINETIKLVGYLVIGTYNINDETRPEAIVRNYRSRKVEVVPELRAGDADSLRDAVVVGMIDNFVEEGVSENQKNRAKRAMKLSSETDFDAWDPDEKTETDRQKVNSELDDMNKFGFLFRHLTGKKMQLEIKKILELPSVLVQLAKKEKTGEELDEVVELLSGNVDRIDAYRVKGHEKKSAETATKQILFETNFKIWKAIKNNDLYRKIVGEKVVDAADQIYGRAAKAILLSTNEHTDLSNTYGWQVLEYNGPEFAAYNIINAWRETGYSGEGPFVTFHTRDSKKTEVYKYIQRQAPETLAAISKDNPSLGKVLKVIERNPDNFHNSNMPRKKPEDDLYASSYDDNPSYYELHGHLVDAGLHMLSNADEKDQFFCLGMLKNSPIALDQKIYQRMDEIFTNTTNKNLREEILKTVLARLDGKDGMSGLRFIVKHFNKVKAEAKRSLEFKRGRLMQMASKTSTTPEELNAIAIILDTSKEKISNGIAVYKEIFASNRDTYQDGRISSNINPDTIIYIGERRSNLISELEIVKSWCPNYHPNIYEWDEREKKASPNTMTETIVRSMFSGEYNASIIKYTHDNNKLPPGVKEVLQSRHKTSMSVDEVDKVFTRAIKLHVEGSTSESLRKFFYGWRGQARLLQMGSAESANIFIDFALEIDKALSWEDVEKFIDTGASAESIDLENPEQINLLKKFLLEFGPHSSQIIFKFYLELMHENTVPSALSEFGVKKAGTAGVNEMRNVLRKVRQDLLETDTVKNPENEVLQEMISTLVRFGTSQWKRSGKQIGEILRELEKYQDSDDSVEVPKEYKTVVMTAQKLDQEKIYEFKFSNGFNNRYEQLASSFEPLKRGESGAQTVSRTKESVSQNLDIEIEAIQKKITEARREGKDERAQRGMEHRLRQLENLKKEIAKANTAAVMTKALLTFDKKENDITTSAIREVLIAHAHDLNPNYSGNVSHLGSSAVTREGATQIMTYVEDLIMAEALPGLNLDKKQKERVRQIFNFSAFKEDLKRLEDFAKKGEQDIAVVFSRGLLAEFSGYYGDACWTRQDDIVKNNPDMIGVAFVNNHGDAINERLVGSCLVFERESNGEKVLIIRGLNPQENIIRGLNAESFLKSFMDKILPIAKRRGITKIAAPLNRAGALTNRPTLNNAFRDMYGQNKTVKLDNKMDFNGYAFDDPVLLVDLTA